MVARTPPKQKKMVAPLNPTLLRETVNKVDKCMARLQELQYTVSGGTKVISGVSLSPRSTRGYLRTSFRCKQESLRIKNANLRKSSSPGKFPTNTAGEWRQMSLPAMLVGETVGEILQASKFAREIFNSVSSKNKKPNSDDPKTPVTKNRKQRPKNLEKTELCDRRKREKQVTLQSIRSESDKPSSLQRARSRINFKVSSPPKKRELERESTKHLANRVSPKNRPWARKTVLFPNPLFHSSPTSQNHKFCKTKSPIIARNRQTPHKFLIKSPTSTSKFQVRIKNPPLSLSPPTTTTKRQQPTTSLSSRKSPKVVSAAAAKLRRSLSPSRLANKFMSPLKSRKSVQKSDEMNMMMMMSGLNQRRTSTPMTFSTRRV